MSSKINPWREIRRDFAGDWSRATVKPAYGPSQGFTPMADENVFNFRAVRGERRNCRANSHMSSMRALLAIAQRTKRSRETGVLHCAGLQTTG
jgi:hypothetical protein